MTASLCFLAISGPHQARAERDGAALASVAPGLAERAPGVPTADPGEIPALLAKAEQEIAEGRMWSPPSDNAADTFRSLLAALPLGFDAHRMQSISAHLAARARSAELGGHHEEAERFTAWAEAFASSPEAQSPPDKNEAKEMGPPSAPAALPAEPPSLPAPPDAHLAGIAPTQPAPNAPATSPGPVGMINVPPAVPAESSAPSDASLPPDLLAFLSRRGDEMMRLGDISAARLFFRRAARAGSAQAASALGATFDPAVLTEIGVRGMEPDPDKASHWYRKAITMGDQDARRRLRELERGPAARAEIRKTTLLRAPRAPVISHAPSILVRPDTVKAARTECRTIVVKVQLGEEPSDAERAALRQGCPLG